MKDLLGYGLPVALSGLLTTLVVNVDYVVVSRVLGPEALGVYTLAFRLPEMIVIGVFQVVSGVTFPVYRRASEQPGRLRNAYLRVLQLQAAYGLIVGFGLASVAPLVVPLLFGQVWEAAVLPMQALAIYAALRSLGLGVVDLLKATGRPNATLLLAACRLVVLLPALLIGAQFGIEGVAWAQVAVALSFALVMQGIAGRVVHAGVLDLSKACAPPVLAGGSTALVALGVDRLLEASQPISLLASVLAGAAVAAMTLLVVSSQLRADATGLLHRLRRRSSPRQAPGA